MLEIGGVSLQTSWLVSGAAGLLVITLGIVLLLYLRKTRDKRYFEKLLKTHATEVLRDVVIADGVDGYVFVDYLILLHNQVLVMNEKHKPGYVFGGEKIHEWTCVENHVTRKFNNPLERVNMFVQSILHVLKFTDIRGYVFFDQQSNFAKGVPSGVLQLDTFESMLEETTEEDTTEAVNDLWQQLKRLTQDAKVQAAH
ncbi:MAG: nuclease-related domain-containing protein [Ghiorsea sp.]